MQNKLNFHLFEFQNTYIGKVNNIVKILLVILLEIIVFKFSLTISTIAITLIIIIAICLGYKIKYLLILIIPIIFLAIFMMLYNIILFGLGIDYILIFGLKLYTDPLYNAVEIFFKFYVTMAPFTLYFFSSSLTQIENGIETLLSPLYYVKFPVGAIVLTLSIAIGSIANIVNDVKRLLVVQAIRGNDIVTQKWSKKVRTVTYLLIPLLVNTVQKAEQLSYSVEVRNFNPFKRKIYATLDKIKASEIIVCFLIFIIIIIVIIK